MCRSRMKFRSRCHVRHQKYRLRCNCEDILFRQIAQSIVEAWFWPLSRTYSFIGCWIPSFIISISSDSSPAAIWSSLSFLKESLIFSAFFPTHHSQAASNSLWQSSTSAKARSLPCEYESTFFPLRSAINTWHMPSVKMSPTNHGGPYPRKDSHRSKSQASCELFTLLHL